MASNRIPSTPDALLSLAEDAADGARDHGNSIQLAQNTEDRIRADLEAFSSARTAFQTAKSDKPKATRGKASVDSEARAFIAASVRRLKSFLGEQWNSEWEAVGFKGGSLALPRLEDERFALLKSLQAYFTQHPDYEDKSQNLNLTAARAEALHTALSDKRNATGSSKTSKAAAKQNMEQARVALARRLTGLRNELGQLLKADDPLWFAFGFNRPDDPETPEIPEGLVLTGTAPGEIMADWDDARRADRYRVYVRLPGQSAFALATTVDESEAELTNLPTGQKVTLIIRAVNEAGESGASDEAEVVVP